MGVASTLKTYEKLSKPHQYAAGLEMLSNGATAKAAEEGEYSMSILLSLPC